jgi:hypothetical protein
MAKATGTQGHGDGRVAASALRGGVSPKRLAASRRAKPGSGPRAAAELSRRRSRVARPTQAPDGGEAA